MNKDLEKELLNAPWDYPGFVLVPGRYFDRLFFIELSPQIIPPYGGDHEGLIWRFDHTPNEWIYTFRNRYYAGPNSDPFTGGDEKHWTVVRGELHKLREFAGVIATGAGKFFNVEKPREEVIIVEGDYEKFFRLIEEGEFPWMHISIKPLNPNPHES